MARLAKGQIAPGIARKADEKAVSVLARLNLLIQLESSTPSEVDTTWLDAFLRQDRLAALRIDEKGITPMSEKTLRRYLVIQGTSMKEITGRALDVAKALSMNVADNYKTPLQPSEERQLRVESTLNIAARYLDLLERLEKVRMSFSAVDSLLDRHLRLFADDRPTRIRRVK